ncbi:hypothetical protein B9G98_04350 [Wickerhamiella sorbophila]|uniref:Cell wall mannoprotein 1 n=1 Tax=Wickerhamiella sorbophila TaxID=45607 RepID=A0A2T0FP19_9ASCO|nr:hypothetical protein B9G98_04350 [Wickerhamiella sorbophila]PRT56730.1 hypothetical protein B9G98_04350 [Wickerhamiella sorbophila]
MLSQITIIAALYSLVAADAAGAISSLQSIVEDLDSKVQSWDSAAGLQGALVIQADIPSLTDAVANLSSELPSSVDNDQAKTLVSNLAPLGAAISALLNDLANKANDFQSVGATEIVKGDISELASPAADVVSKAINGLPTDADSDVLGSASSIVSVVSAGFSTGAEAFGAPTVAWPVVNVGDASAAASGASSAAASGASSAGSAAASDAASSAGSAAASDAASSAAKSDAAVTSAAETSSAAKSSAKSSSASNSTKTSSKSSSSSSSDKSSNAAVLTTYGVGAALAGAVAMLL